MDIRELKTMTKKTDFKPPGILIEIHQLLCTHNEIMLIKKTTSTTNVNDHNINK